MILLKQYESEGDAARLAERLRARGVLTHISSIRSKRKGAFTTGAFRVGVWLVLDHQAKDAIALLSNKRHKVENPLTEEEMVELESKIGASGGALYHFAVVVISVVVFLLVVSYALLK